MKLIRLTNLEYYSLPNDILYYKKRQIHFCLFYMFIDVAYRWCEHIDAEEQV